MKLPDILVSLRQLGIRNGDKVLVHSSFVALGEVDGGPDAVIDALLEAIGSDGLVVMPTFACEPPFDRKSSVTPLGVVADRFWRRPDAVRSMHPTHSVAAIGKGADDLIRDHENARTAYGEGTPYCRLARSGGKILLLGVDQDRNTTLHAAEAITDAAYLETVEASYIDDNGELTTTNVPAMAGPHRDFIGLDKLFKAAGIMKMGHIGSAVCRLIEAGPMLDIAIDSLRSDPAAVLCSNPACTDCVMQRGRIKAARLADENFTLAGVAGDISDNPREIVDALRGEGISTVEITREEYSVFGDVLIESGIKIAAIQSLPDDGDAAALARELDVPLIVSVITVDHFHEAMRLVKDSGSRVMMMNNGAPSSFYAELFDRYPNAPPLAFNPAKFADAQEKPFLGVFYHGSIRTKTQHFYIDDGTSDGIYAVPGQGNAEVKEIISILRCRSYDGIMTLRSHEPKVEGFRRAAAAFWNLLNNM